jgi:guanylate kinase
MIVLCGKTCSGKNFIRDKLIEQGIEPVVTYTTRPKRDGEVDGKTYNYLTKEDFEKKNKEGFFVESTSYNVESGETWFYGSHFNKEDNNKVIILNPQGVDAIISANNLEVTPVVFFLDAPDDILRERLKARGDNLEKAERRLKIDAKDFKDIYSKTDIILRNTGKVKPEKLVQIILDFHNHTLKNPAPWKAPQIDKEMHPKKDIKLDIVVQHP